MPEGDSFYKTTDAKRAPFDFDAFIKGTQLARRTVAAFRVDHRDQILHLTAEHDQLPVETDERESTGATPRQELATRIAELRAEMEASRVEWVIRNLTPEEYKTCRDDPKLDIYDQIGLQSTAPEDAEPGVYDDLCGLTAEQWRKIAAVVGTYQWAEITALANDLVTSRVVVPDFSQSVSETLSPPEPSES